MNASGEALDIRIASPADRAMMADYMMMASGGLLEHLFGGLIAGIDLRTFLELAIAEPDSPFSFENALIAQAGGVDCGMLLAFPAGVGEAIEGPAQETVAAALDALELGPEQGLYVNSVAVDPGHRGQGIGGLLLEAAGQIAIAEGLETVTLHVWLANEPALRLYRTSGFEPVRTMALPLDPAIRVFPGEIALMQAPAARLAGEGLLPAR